MPNKIFHSNKVVISKNKAQSIDFGEWIFNSKKKSEITTLSESQQKAIRNIEDYWINRAKNSKNWNKAKHFSFNKESISTRLSENEYRLVKSKYNTRKISNFIRLFLRNENFRKEAIEKINNQFKNDSSISIQAIDITDYLAKLQGFYPKVISAKIQIVEKELFIFFFRFVLLNFSVSFALRCILLNYDEIEDQDPFNIDEIPILMYELLKSVLNNK